MCSPRGEVTISEFCFLKGFCKTVGPQEGFEGHKNGVGEGEGNGDLVLWSLEAAFWVEGCLYLPPLGREVKMSSPSPPYPTTFA